MKRFILKTFIILFSIITIYTIFCLIIPPNESSYIYAYKDKIKHLKTYKDNKIVLIGGSNVAFGINSKLIEDSLGLKTFNIGLHANIGLKYYLDDISKYIKQGDIIVICPEYQQFYGLLNGKYELAEVCKVMEYDNIRNLNLQQWINLLMYSPRNAYNNFVHTLKNEKISGLLYTRYGFDENGDEISHLSMKSVKNITVSTLNSNPQLNDCIWISKKIKQLKQITPYVLLIPPICIESFYKANTDKIKLLYTIINSMSQYGFVLEPICNVVPDCYAFDSEYHMNNKGIKFYTHQIIFAIEKFGK